jgi:hypothetical protein
MSPRLLLQVPVYFLLRRGLPVGAVRSQPIPHVHHGEDARRQGNLLTLKSARITTTIPFFVAAVRGVRARRRYGIGDSSSQA